MYFSELVLVSIHVLFLGERVSLANVTKYFFLRCALNDDNAGIINFYFTL